MAGNANLGAAKAAKNDEFYTQWGDIENEMQAYLEYDPDVFRDKTILLPCDDPDWSNFTKYFAERFEQLGLKKLISTSYAAGGGNGKVFVLECENEPQWGYLAGDGDFRSDEVTALRDEADMVITNPPFSIFREFLAWLVEGDVKFSIIGNTNSVTYKEIFPLIKCNKMWKGATANSSDMVFEVPLTADVKKSDLQKAARLGYPSIDGKKFTRLGNSCWFTNIEHGRRHEPLVLMTMEDNLLYGSKRVRKTAYVKYDNYDAIEVPETKAIPSDYTGAMGVPISFLDRYSPEQFEILGITDRQNTSGLRTRKYTSADSPRFNDLNARSVIKHENGEYQQVYARILIRRHLTIQSLSRSRSGRSSLRCKRGFSHVEVRG